MILNEYQLRYLLKGRNRVRFFKGSHAKIDPSARLAHSRIFVLPGASLTIGQNCMLRNTDIYVAKGSLVIGDHTIIGGEDELTSINIADGEACIGHHCLMRLKRIWVRFGGKLSIGEYTNINRSSEIRCDESVTIKEYCQISYDVRIWDTNTHSILSPDERRELTRNHFPYFGFEVSRPATSPVKIGCDCWIGESAGIFKGSEIGDRSIIGFGSRIFGKRIPADSRVVNEISLSLKTPSAR